MSDQVLQPGVRRVVLPGGGVAFVRPVSRSQMVRLMGAVGHRAGVSHSDSALMLATFQWSLLGLENATSEAGGTVEYATTKHPTLGVIASDGVFDAMSEDDILAIYKASGSKAEEQRPN